MAIDLRTHRKWLSLLALISFSGCSRIIELRASYSTKMFIKDQCVRDAIQAHVPSPLTAYKEYTAADAFVARAKFGPRRVTITVVRKIGTTSVEVLYFVVVGAPAGTAEHLARINLEQVWQAIAEQCGFEASSDVVIDCMEQRQNEPSVAVPCLGQ